MIDKQRYQLAINLLKYNVFILTRFKMQKEIYFDNSATTRQFDEVTELIADVSRNIYGNPSSLHTKGIEAERVVNTARNIIAASLGAQSKEIYFTSGGTESNNLAIRGYLYANPRKGKHLITTKIEHPSVLEVFRFLEQQGYSVDYIDVDENGKILMDQLREKLTADTALISVMLVNNETGTIQSINEISAIRDGICPGAVIHVDAVQAYGKIKICPAKSGIGMLSISSHKIHGPKGIGALYVAKDIKIKPILFGGGQESLLRSGTENVPGIAGFGEAARLVTNSLEAGNEKVAAVKEAFLRKLEAAGLAYKVVSPPDASPYILNIAFDDIKAEVLLHHLEQRGIFVSTGSACSSHKNTKSHVLTAMKVPQNLIDGALRFSFSASNSVEEAEAAAEAVKEIIPVIEIHKKQKIRRQQ
jgi:cysteine desulfurase